MRVRRKYAGHMMILSVQTWGCLYWEAILPQEAMVSSTGDDGRVPFSIGSTFWCGDATNSSIWKRQKLQGMLLSSSFMTNWAALSREEYTSAFTTMKSMYLSLSQLTSDYSCFCFINSCAVLAVCVPHAAVVVVVAFNGCVCCSNKANRSCTSTYCGIHSYTVVLFKSEPGLMIEGSRNTFVDAGQTYKW